MMDSWRACWRQKITINKLAEFTCCNTNRTLPFPFVALEDSSVAAAEAEELVASAIWKEKRQKKKGLE